VPEGRTLVLLRHGETEWNAVERAQGHADVPLNAVGHAQAEAVAGALAGFDPVRLWSSDLARAMETAEHVAAATGLPIEPDPRLREYDVGRRSGLTLDEFAATYPDVFASWKRGDGRLRVPGEEGTDQVRDRIVPALSDCLGALEPGTTGIAVLHGACLKVGLMAMLGWPWELSRSLRGLDNCGFSVLAESGPNGELRLTSYNERVSGAGRPPDFAADAPVG
jgi:glucosyl-3-phosphoglycerate phosphatase